MGFQDQGFQGFALEDCRLDGLGASGFRLLRGLEPYELYINYSSTTARSIVCYACDCFVTEGLFLIVLSLEGCSCYCG